MLSIGVPVLASTKVSETAAHFEGRVGAEVHHERIAAVRVGLPAYG
jgi:hypothetical protein